MGTQNILNYYGNRLDAKLSYSGYYDFYLASDEDNFKREVVYSDNIIGYEEPRTPQLGNLSNSLPLWIDLNNTGCTLQPAFTGVSVVQQEGYFSFNSAGTQVYECRASSFTMPEIKFAFIMSGQVPSGGVVDRGQA